MPVLGPAFVTAIAYVDPGNVATNTAAGAGYGYLLVWVLVSGNLMAVLVQYLSAKVGVATGHHLAELCRKHYPRPVVLGLWVQAEAVMMATDLAEVLGGAVALHLLFGVPLPLGGLVTAGVAFVLLSVESRGARRFEVVVGALLAVLAAGFLYSLVVSGLDPGRVAAGLVPRLGGPDTVLLAAGMLGATVMPHAIYLHGALTRRRVPVRDDVPTRHLLRDQRIDVVAAMLVAGLVNLAMVVVAAELLHTGPDRGVELETAHEQLAVSVGPGAALAFGIALLASGLAATGVGTLAGQVVMQGFLRRRVPLLLRRVVTVSPAIAVLAWGVEPTSALVVSQVMLSFGIPFALVPLVSFTRRRDVMGEHVNSPVTTFLASGVAGVVSLLNLSLIVLTLAG